MEILVFNVYHHAYMSTMCMMKLMVSFNSYFIAAKYTKFKMINEINIKVTLKSNHTSINFAISMCEIAQI